MSKLDDWQSEQEDRPFAMWLSFPDPHELYQAPKDIYEMIGDANIDLPLNWESDIENRAEFIQFFHWYFNKGGVPKEDVLKLDKSISCYV